MKSRNWNWLTCCKFSLKAVICALALIICLTTKTAFSVAASMPVNSIAVVTAETKLNLREKPQGKIIGKLPHGEYVVILSEIDRNGYYRIRVQSTGLECYAYGEYLKLVSAGTVEPERPTLESEEEKKDVSWVDNDDRTVPEGAILVVTSDAKLNMRKGPSRKADRIKYLYNGDKLHIVSSDVKNNYVLVRDSKGKVGYVSLDYVVFESIEAYKICSPENCCPNCICQMW